MPVYASLPTSLSISHSSPAQSKGDLIGMRDVAMTSRRMEDWRNFIFCVEIPFLAFHQIKTRDEFNIVDYDIDWFIDFFFFIISQVAKHSSERKV